jgi:DmsE family decaheme c-type cytochrome
VPEAKFIRAFVLILFALCLAVSQPAHARQEKSTGATRPSDPNLYAGTETCVTCHDEIGAIHEKSPHRKTELSKAGPGFKGCEGCHGPGKAHAESGGDTGKIVSFKSLSRAESTKVCLDCHGQKESHAEFLRSQHGRNGIGCLDCHSPHKARVEAALLKASQPQMCSGCHQNVKPDSSKSLHHKTYEGLRNCTECHSPHVSEP